MQITNGLKRLSLFLTTACLILTDTKAIIVQNKCITKIAQLREELSENLEQTGSTIAVFDLDDTLINGSPRRNFEFREPGENGTLEVLNSLQETGIQTMIMTQRLRGLPMEGNEADLEDRVKIIMQLLIENEWIQHGPFENTHAIGMPIPGAVSRPDEKDQKQRQLHMMAKNHIVFAGGNDIKGMTMKFLLANNVFKNIPENIIFIDNDDKNTKEFAEAFKDEPQKVYIYHYPGPKNKPCEEQIG